MPTDREHWQLLTEVAELRAALNKTIRLLRMAGMSAVTGGTCTERELRAFVSMPLSDEEKRFGFKPARPLAPPPPGLTRKEVLELFLEVLDMTYSREGDPVYGDDCDALLSAMRTGLNELLQKQEAHRG